MSRRPRQSNPYDSPIPVIRVGDLVLTRADGAGQLSRARAEAHAVTVDGLGTADAIRAQQLPNKQAGLLAFLMRHHRAIVSKSRLIDAVWGSEGVEPGVFDVHMARLRRTLQHFDASGDHIRIETRRGMGYALHVEGE